MKTPEELMEEIDKRTWTTKVKILEAIHQRDAEIGKAIDEICDVHSFSNMCECSDCEESIRRELKQKLGLEK